MGVGEVAGGLGGGGGGLSKKGELDSRSSPLPSSDSVCWSVCLFCRPVCTCYLGPCHRQTVFVGQSGRDVGQSVWSASPATVTVTEISVGPLSCARVPVE